MNDSQSAESVEKNIAARKVAIEVFCLVVEEGGKHGVRFWEKMKSLVDIMTAPVTEKKDETKKEKMTEDESKLFGKNMRMQFGEFVGKRIDEVPLDRLLWYAEQTFTDELRRYVKSDRVQREQEE